MKIVFWHGYLMFHQAPYIRELARMPGTEVHWCVHELLPAAYRERGYPLPDTGAVHVHVAPSDSQMEQLLAQAGSVHVFFGLRGMPLSARAFKASLGRDVHRFLMSENRYEPGLRLLPRWLVYGVDALRYRNALDGVFCIGYYGRHGGRRFFSRCGYPKDKLLPFLHMVEALEQAPTPRTHGTLRFIYVGQLIPRKRVDLLLRAFARLKEMPRSLQIVGAGPAEDALRRMADSAGLRDTVEFRRGMSNAQVREAMSDSDILVLPSRFDGWGAVVNEALMVGTAVVCSDRCGASDLIEQGRNGYVFRSGDVGDLERGMRAMAENVGPARHEEIASHAKRFSVEPVASYFRDAVLWRIGQSDTHPATCWHASLGEQG